MASILIIDDDPQVLKLLSSYMQREGHQVITAGDGVKGMKQLALSRFDLLITDIVMPEQDGLGILMKLREQTGRPKIIAISGGSPHLRPELVLDIASYTADRVMQKPVEREELVQAVNELLATPQ